VLGQGDNEIGRGGHEREFHFCRLIEFADDLRRFGGIEARGVVNQAEAIEIVNVQIHGKFAIAPGRDERMRSGA